MTTDRPWDPYLNPAERVALSPRLARVRSHTGCRPCLLLVDLYRWVFGDTPTPDVGDDAVSDWPGSFGSPAWEALPQIAHLLQLARQHDVPVVHTTESPSSPMRSWSAGREQGVVPDERWLARYEIVEQVAPVSGELVVVKEAPSAFWGTPLLGHLISLGVDTVVVAGESTSGCIRATVVDAASYRYDVLVAEECVFDRHQFVHAANLLDIQLKYGDVLSTDDVLAFFGSCRDG